jgi:serine kinase of HPr protein (carbohydrate metabolism regulator)
VTPQVINIHASCVVVGRAGDALGAPGDAGLLLLGESGSGKSDLALRLIGLGAELVADDRCDLFVSSGVLHATAPSALAGMIEVRGLGIVSMPYRSEAQIKLVVRLAASDAVPRMPEPRRYRPPGSLTVPESGLPHEILLAPFEASTPIKIIAAIAAFTRSTPVL